MAINFCSLYALLVSSFFLTNIQQTSCVSVQKVMLHHEHSGQFVEGTPTSGPVTATGGTSGKLYHNQNQWYYVCASPYRSLSCFAGTEFYPHQSGDSFTYESAADAGKYLIMSNQGSFSVGSTSEGIYEFTKTAVGDFFKLSADVSGTTCYLAFDEDENQLSNPRGILMVVLHITIWSLVFTNSRWIGAWTPLMWHTMQLY